MHIALRPLLVGVEGWPWQQLAGATLAATCVGLVCLYSTSLRIDLPTLKDVEVPQDKDNSWWAWFFGPSTEACFLKDKRELSWAPALDLRTGETCSEEHSVTHLEDGRLDVAPGKRQPGLTRAQEAERLAGKALSNRLRVYTRRKDAYFHGLTDRYMQADDIEELRAAVVPAAEALLTDALVVHLCGTVPQATLEDSLQQLAPLLMASRLAARLRGSRLPWAERSWAHGAGSGAELLSDLRLRAAQLRELIRLEGGEAPGPYQAADLASSLESGGVDCLRAREALASVGWHPGDSLALRGEDWMLLGHLRRRQRREAVTSSVAAVAGLAVLGLGLYAAVSGES